MNAGDVIIKPLPVKLDDKDRTLLFDFNSLVCLEEIYGSIEQAMEELTAAKAKAIRDFIWAGLLHEDEELTPKEVGRMMTIHNMNYLVGVIADGLGLSMPKAEGKKATKKQK